MSDSPNPNGEQTGKDTRFKPGQIANPAGRPKGSRNALGEDFLKALHDDFKTNGVAAIQACRADKPDVYVKVIAGLLPKEMTLNVNPTEEMADDELINELRTIRAAVNAALGQGGDVGTGAESQAINTQAPTLPALH